MWKTSDIGRRANAPSSGASWRVADTLVLMVGKFVCGLASMTDLTGVTGRAAVTTVAAGTGAWQAQQHTSLAPAISMRQL